MLKNKDLIEDGYALYHSVGHRPNGSQEMAAAVSDFSLMWTAPIPDVWPKALSMLEEFRQSFSMLLGPNASSEEIGLVDSVTSGFLRIIDGLGSDYLKDKSILIADDAFPSLHFLLQGMQKLLKFKIRRVAIRQGQYHVENSDYIKELKNEDVALALVTWVSSTTSAMVDLEAIATDAPKNCILVCDATQCIGVRKLDLPNRFDALLSTSLKWLCGTAGAGVIWVRKSRIELFEPKFRGWFSQENPMNWDIDNFHLATNSKRFENGTPNPLPYVAGLPGLNWVVQGGNILQEKHNSRMTGELIELLVENRINLVTPIEPNARGGSVMVNVGTIENAKRVIDDCARESVLIDNRGSILRFSPGILTKDFAIECFVSCILRNI